MANPNLKAQIEAAKSALASDLAAPSLVAPPPKQPMAPTMTGDDIATDAKPATANSGNAVYPVPAGGKSAHTTNATALDERISQLEAKLSDNQRDLHTLLQKIREVSRLQANSGQSRKSSVENKVAPRRSSKSPVVMVAMAALIGLAVGIAYYLATAKDNPSALTVPRWVLTIVDSFNGWIG
jgi:hypothetical protein